MRILLISLLFTHLSFASWKLTSYNIRNFDNDPGQGRTNLKILAALLKEQNSDVFGFQEIVNKSAFDKLIKDVLPTFDYKTSICGGGGSQKLALAFNPKKFKFLSTNENLKFSDLDVGECGSLRPLFTVSLQSIETQKIYQFHLVHLKAGSSAAAMATRWQQYKMLKDIMSKSSESDIFLGDFNTTGYILNDKDFDRFQQVLSSTDFRTSAEQTQCTNFWEGPKNSKEFQPSILDHIVVKDSVFKSIQSVNVAAHCQKVSCRPVKSSELGASYEEVSDHCPVQVEFH